MKINWYENRRNWAIVTIIVLSFILSCHLAIQWGGYERTAAFFIKDTARWGRLKPITAIQEKGKAVRLTRQQRLESRASTNPLIPFPSVDPAVLKSFYFRKYGGRCDYYCRRFIAKGWKRKDRKAEINVFAAFHMAGFKRKGYVPSKYIVNILREGVFCLGSSKSLELITRRKFAEQDGCDVADLNVQPLQWNIKDKAECESFFQQAKRPENANTIWILKPTHSFHGQGIKLMNNISEIQEKYTCGASRYVVQKYISKPALMSGHKFDMRTYILIASRDPLIVFVHRGFIRKSMHEYNTDLSSLNDTKSHITNSHGQNLKDHYFGFNELGETLTKESNFPPNYMNETFMPQAKRISNYIVQAAIKFCMSKVKGRYQVFGLDWILGSDGKVYLLEANTSPSLKAYPGNTNFSPALIDDMIDIVHNIHVEPKAFGDVDFSVKGKYRYKGWEMIYNELEANSTEQYRACKMNDYVTEKNPLYSYLP